MKVRGLGIILIITTLEHEYWALYQDKVRPPGHSLSKGHTDEQRLLESIMHLYDRNTRPVMNASHPVRVKLGLTLNQIFDVDERNQVLTTHIWLDQEWYDEKLQWDPEEFNGLSTLRVPCHLLWKPDIVLYNSADDYTTGYMPALAMVAHDGHVFWPPIVKLRSTCKIDITYFPFDDQKCSLKLGSWAYDGLQVDVLKRGKPMDLSNYVSNGEWELINVKVVRNVEYYSCCPEPYPDVTFTFHIRRRTLYYTYNVIIPCIMLSCLTLLGFWMPPEGGEKVALGLTVLLAFSVFMLLIAENMPATSFYIPLIGVYIIVAMGLTCVSVTLAVIISYLYHQSIMGREVPDYLRKIGRFLNSIFKVRPYMMSQLKHAHKNGINMNSSDVANHSTPLRESFSSINFTFRTEADGFDFENVHFDRDGATNKRDISTRKNTHANKRKAHAHKNATSAAEELIRRLDVLLARQEELLKRQDELKPYCNREWQEIAEVIDRTLFWVYTIVTTTLTIIILLLVPLGKTVSL